MHLKNVPYLTKHILISGFLTPITSLIAIHKNSFISGMVEKNLKLNISFTFLGKLIGLFAPFVISELLLKNLGGTEYSDYLLLMQLLAMMTLLDCGIVNGCARVLNRIATNNGKLVMVVLFYSLKYILVISLTVSISSFVLMSNTSSLDNEILFLLISIYFVTQIYRISSVLLIANNQIYITQIVETFASLLRLLLLFVFVHLVALTAFCSLCFIIYEHGTDFICSSPSISLDRF